jgi:hypothetical protein
MFLSLPFLPMAAFVGAASVVVGPADNIYHNAYRYHHQKNIVNVFIVIFYYCLSI